MGAKAAAYQAMMPEKPKEDLSSKLLSPMPGTVVSINVEVGDSVLAGQSVAVVEAMKMQNGELFRGVDIFRMVNFLLAERISQEMIL